MNNYHIYEEVGKGKFSTVYKGRKKKGIEYVAVKSLEKSRRKKVLNEVRIFHNLNHNNILKFYNWYETRNHLWIIFEYCAGGDLLQLVEQDKALPENIVKAFGRDLINGLQYLHTHGIIFCDLKPSNVLMNEYGTLKLSDFGLARKIVDLVQADNKSEAGAKKGTPYYMAPELFQEEGVYSFSSDFWALGCVLYELATGKPPFTSSSFQELVNLIVNSDTPLVDKFSKDFNDLITKLLEKDPSKRITWDSIIYHPFWTPYEFSEAKYPNQPQFEEYLKKKSKVTSTPSSKERDRSPGLSSKASFPIIETNSTQTDLQVSNTKDKKNVDVVRMSHNIMKNMLKEAQLNSGYEEKEGSSIRTEQDDIKLTNHNQELNFGEGGDDEDDEETKDADTNEQKGEDNVEEEKVDNQNLTKIEFNKKKEPSSSEKTTTLTKVVSRNLKPENDDLSATPKNGRSNTTLTEDAERLATANFLTGQKSQPKIDSTDKSKKVPPVDQLLIHTSDTVVKPITGNKEIEKPVECTFTREMLTFAPMIPEEVVKGIDTPQVENHLAEIYNYIASNTPNVLDKLNALNYFEIIIQNASVANRLVNSAFMTLLVKLAKVSKNVSLKTKICIIIGHLIRHATVIENELSQLGIPAVMAEIMKEKNEKVRRKAVAALGEYLFYAATQIDEDATNSVWDINTTIIALLLKTIKSNDDDTVRFYACKTVENITAQSVNVGIKFANLEFASACLGLYATTKNESLKICAAVTLGHISRLNASLTWPILEKLTLRHICSSFTDANVRIQQVFITMINQFLQSGGSKVYTTLAEESSFIPSLIGLLDHSAVFIRGKCLLTFYLMFKTNLKWMMAMSENKFGTLLDRLSRDAYKYVQCCLIHLVDLVSDLIPIILKNIEEELQGLKKKMGSLEEEGTKDYIPNYLGLMPIILGVMNSLLLRNKIVNNNFLLVMFKIYDLCEETKSRLSDDFRTTVFMIFEGFSSNHKLLIANNEIVLKILFPNLVSKITSENADSRFNGLKLITDIMIQYLGEESIYDVNGQKPSAKLINEIITSDLLPNIKFILNDQEPMPLYGLKLFSIVIGKNINFVGKLKQNNMLKFFLEYFNSNHPRLTSNTLKIIVKIVECKDVSLDELVNLNFLAKAVQIFRYFFTNQQEWCYEELLDILLNYLNKILDNLKEQKVNIISLENTYNPTTITEKQALTVLKTNEAFLEIVDIFISLTNHAEIMIADRSLGCLLNTLYIFGSIKKDKVIAKPDQVASMLGILSVANKQSIWKKTAKSLLWIAFLQEYQIYIPSDKKNLISLLDKHKNSEDKAISFCCKELKNCIKS